MGGAPADAECRVRAALERLLQDLPAFGVAVSGGGDSTALMHMIAGWDLDRRVHVATVDHGLRVESTAEAQVVAKKATELGFPHEVLNWQRVKADGGNLMANAREARLRLLSDWARRNALPAILLGHTADDQAETLLMRLSRGAGIDGLSGMAERRHSHDTLWLRPMLEISRAQLRHWLSDREIDWVDDPSNDNSDFDRIRIRQAMTTLAIDPLAIAQSAANLRDARLALDHFAAQFTRGAIARNGTLLLPRAPLQDAPHEVFRRLLIAGCRWVTGADYPPRRQTVLHAIESLNANNRVTLDGVLIEPVNDTLRLIREPQAAKRAGQTQDPIWDNRWHISGLRTGEYIAALGTAPLVELPWRDSQLGRDESAASPAVWKDGELQAVPLLQPCSRLSTRPLRNAEDFHSALLSH